MQPFTTPPFTPNIPQSVASAAQPLPRSCDRRLADQTVRGFSKAWVELARASRLQSPMFDHPLAVTLLRRERLVSSRPAIDRSRADRASPILTDSLGQAMHRFQDYCAAHFERELEGWRTAQAAVQAQAGRSRPTA